MTDFLLYLAAGAAAGALAGLFGVGGGLIIVSILMYLFSALHFSEQIIMHLALGTSFATILLTSLSSARAHNLKGNVIWSIVYRLALPVMAGTLAGSFLASRLDVFWLKGVFAIFVLLVATQLILNMAPNPHRQLHGKTGLSIVGAIIGFVSSLVGIGGGTMTVPYLVYCNANIRQAIGTSAATGFPIALAGTVGYIFTGLQAGGLPQWSVGFVYVPAFAGITLASILAAPWGAALAHRLPMPALKRLFALLLYFVALNMLREILVTVS